MRSFEIAKGWEDKGVKLPVRSTRNSAGYDFFAAEDVTIEPCQIRLVPTGVKAKMAEDEVLLLFNRSSMPFKKRLVLINGVGVVDADYYGNESNDGHILFAFMNITNLNVPVTIKKGEKIGQGVFTKYLLAENDEVLDAERVGGFGSTGGHA